MGKCRRKSSSISRSFQDLLTKYFSMHENFYGGLDFGTSGARISIINTNKELVYSNSVPYSYNFKNPNSWINSCEKLLGCLPIEVKSNLQKLAISGTSGTLTASNLRGEPIGEAISYDQAVMKKGKLI